MAERQKLAPGGGSPVGAARVDAAFGESCKDMRQMYANVIAERIHAVTTNGRRRAPALCRIRARYARDWASARSASRTSSALRTAQSRSWSSPILPTLK